MESVHCNLCGSQETVLVRVARDYQYGSENSFRLVRCTRCNLVYLNPRPNQREMPAHYPPQYQAAIRQVVQDVRQSRVGRLGLQMMRSTRTPPLAGPGRVLDIGCSSGYYLVALRNVGWEVHGVEVDAEVAKYAREQFGLSVRTGAAEDVLSDFPDECFDVVTMWHVLEHLFDPSGVLMEVHRILRPGGVLMLELPNFDSLPAFLLGEYWHPLEIPRHLYYFTPQTLQAMIAKAGFCLTRLTGVPAPQETIWSFYVLWARCTRKPQGERLVWHPAFTILLFPACWLLAQVGLSTFLAAVATKPASHTKT